MTSLITRLKRTEDPVVRTVPLRGRGAAHYAACGHALRSRTVAAYFGATQQPKLHFGAGPYKIPGWLTTDLIAGDTYLDLEHLSEGAGTGLVGKLRRGPAARRGSTAHHARPAQDARDLREPQPRRLSHGLRSLPRQKMTGKRHERPCQLLNHYLRLWGHQWIYDE